jgi:hypothetical protein
MENIENIENIENMVADRTASFRNLLKKSSSTIAASIDDISNTNNNTGTPWIKIIIYIILIVLGYLIITNLGSILSYLGYTTAEVTKKTISMGAEGSKALIDVASDTVTGGISSLERGLSFSNKNYRNNIDNKKILVQETNDKGSNEFTDILNKSKTRIAPKNEIEPRPISGKDGYCYVGEDRGFRSCIKISHADKCMSGDIFPTSEICINPSLRY